MSDETRREVEALASQILTSYYRDSDVEFFISTLDPDVVWLGAGENQKAEGREAVAACFRGGKDELFPCDISQEHYLSREIAAGCYYCQADSWVESKPGIPRYARAHQRITLIFRRNTQGELKTLHIHHSLSFADLLKEELFPAQATREAYQRLENMIQRKDNQIELMLSRLPGGMLICQNDGDYQIRWVSDSLCAMLGYAHPEDFLRGTGKQCRGFMHAGDFDAVWQEVKASLENGEPYNVKYRARRGDGSLIWVSDLGKLVVEENGESLIYCFISDITDIHNLQLAQEQERLLENRYLRAAICTAYPLIMSINLTKNTYHCFIEEQDTYTARRQGSFDQLVAETSEMIYPSYQEDYRLALDRETITRRFAEGERQIYLETRQKGVDGKYHWISLHLIYVDNPIDSDVLAIELVKVLDSQRIERARQEQLLRDALASAKAANSAKSDFLSRMSHDIRTPMNAIIGMSAIGQLRIDDKAQVEDCFQKIDASSRYLLSLINDILDMSKIETSKMTLSKERFDFGRMIDEIVEILTPQARERKIAFEVQLDQLLERRYRGDPLRLKQILMNLLSNALKFTPAGGRVSLEVQVKSERGFSYIIFIVSDTGIGMSEEFIPKLFQPFEQETAEGARDYVGSGLGLSIVYNLTRLMDGTIQVESRKGQGTAFTVTIPLKAAGEESPDNAGADSPNAAELKEGGWLADSAKEPATWRNLAGRRVLLVEDNGLNLEIARSLLELNGLLVEPTENGQEAVDCFSAAGEGYFDLILMDIRMPVMDGLAAARAIRALERPDAKRVPILAMSANAFEEDKRQAAEAGMNGYIVKPLDVRILRRTLERFLKEH